MANLFKKKASPGVAEIRDLTRTETALSQSTFNVEKITEIQGKFTGGEVLLVPGRIFIREGMLWKVCRKGPKRRQFFLFNDVLVYGSVAGRGRYTNQHHLPLARMSVSASCHYLPQVGLDGGASVEELDPENAFQISHADKSFHVYAQSKADKGNWINNLQKQISRVASSNTDKRNQAQYRAVWVPDAACKNCMVCKKKFSPVVRKHHCRMCGRVVCSGCSPYKADISVLAGGEPSSRAERICSECNKQSSSSQQEKTENPTVAQRDEDADSTETEDSDDSDAEEPVPPPRHKKNPQQQNAPPSRPPIPPRPNFPQVKAKQQVQEPLSEHIQDPDNDSTKYTVTETVATSASVDKDTLDAETTAPIKRDKESFKEKQVSLESSSEEHKRDDLIGHVALTTSSSPNTPNRKKVIVQLEESMTEPEEEHNQASSSSDSTISPPKLQASSGSMHMRLRRSKFTVPNNS